MDQELTVEIVLKCDRTGKTYRKEVPADQAQKEIEVIKNKQQDAKEIEDFLTLRNKAGHADFAVLYKGQVVVLPNVNAKYDTTIKRLLSEATQQKKVFGVAEKQKKTQNSGKSKRNSSDVAPEQPTDL